MAPRRSDDVIECVAVPIERKSVRSRTRPRQPGSWIWILVAVLGMFKLAAAVIVALWAIRRYPRMILGALAGLGGLVGLAAWRGRRERLSGHATARTRPTALRPQT